jgi:hypothetical protein
LIIALVTTSNLDSMRAMHVSEGAFARASMRYGAAGGHGLGELQMARRAPWCSAYKSGIADNLLV